MLRLTSGVTKLLKILDNPQAVLLVRNVDIQIVLLSVRVDGEAFERQHPAGTELRLDGTGEEDRALDPQRLHPLLQHVDLDRDNTRHLNRPTERDLAVSLREVQVSHRKSSSLHVHRQIRLTSPRQVLDIAIPAMLRSTRHSPRSLAPNLRLDLPRSGAGVDIEGLRRVRDDTVFDGSCVDEFLLATVPLCEELGGRHGAHDAGVDETREADAGDVSRGTEDAFKVPNGFGRLGVLVVEEAAAVVFVKDGAEAW